MNTRNKTATKFYTSEHADSSAQIGLAGREVAPESVMSEGNATHHLSPFMFRKAQGQQI
ncbi:hypothetical protein ACPV30_19180 [Photobacterium damselae]|uniref:hypothetical protein n=1 Tax=Photobacterium damselae TaxID=38293 RepID=UPI004067F55D